MVCPGSQKEARKTFLRHLVGSSKRGHAQTRQTLFKGHPFRPKSAGGGSHSEGKPRFLWRLGGGGGGDGLQMGVAGLILLVCWFSQLKVGGEWVWLVKLGNP